MTRCQALGTTMHHASGDEVRVIEATPYDYRRMGESLTRAAHPAASRLIRFDLLVSCAWVDGLKILLTTFSVGSASGQV